MNWQERAEKAEAELERMRGQEPIKYLYRVTDCFGHDVLRDDPKGATILETIPLYAATIPAPAVPAYLLERQENGLSWYIGAATRYGSGWHWTADVNSAIRFSREKDAVACWNIIARHHVGIGGSGTTETTPKQHIFEDARALLQSPVVKESLTAQADCHDCNQPEA